MPRRDLAGQWDLPVLAFEVSRHAQVLRLRRVARSLASDAAERVAFLLSGQSRHTKMVISELNGWPVYTSYRCHTHTVASISVRIEAKTNG